MDFVIVSMVHVYMYILDKHVYTCNVDNLNYIHTTSLYVISRCRKYMYYIHASYHINMFRCVPYRL